MALVKVKPTSAGRRSLVKVVNQNLHKGRPFDALTEKKTSKAGRNNHGHITTRHQGGGHKQHYRVIDFKRNKDGVVAKVERLEYDPNRSANIALLCYADGERRYIIAPKGMMVGQEVLSGSEAPIKSGNSLPIRNIPWVAPSTVSRSCLVKGHSSHVLPVRRCNCWHEKVHMRKFAYAQEKFDAFM